MIQFINVPRLSLECTEYSHLHYQKQMYVDLGVYFTTWTVLFISITNTVWDRITDVRSRYASP